MKTLIAFFLLFTANLLAQPGSMEIRKNLNDFSETELKQYLKRKSFYEYTFEIDSTTSFDKLKLLSSFESLTFVINLPSIPNEFLAMRFDSLKTLEIFFGPKFRSLKAFSDWNLEHLKELRLSFDTDTEQWEEFCDCTHLESLKIVDFKGKTLPKALKNLTSLNTLALHAPNMENIGFLTKIHSLENLVIECKQLKSFPEFEPDNNIQTFRFHADSGFVDYDNISTLSKLKTLQVSGGIKKWPGNFSKNLERLYFSDLPFLEDVSQLSQYQNLKTIGITRTGLKQFSGDFSTMSKLSDLWLSNNDALHDLSGLGSLTVTDKIEISNLPALSEMDFDMSRSNFKKITLQNLINLNNIDAITSCNQLETLFIIETALKSLPKNFGKLESLTSLYLTSNAELSDISALKKMKSLERIRFSAIPKLKEIPGSFSTNSALESLDFQSMPELKTPKGIAGLKNLKSIMIGIMHPDFLLPKDLEKSTNIEKIIIQTPIKDVSMIRNLKQLKHLMIMYSLSEIPPSLYTNDNLQVFELYQSRVVDLSSLTKFKKLTELRIMHNPYLEKLPVLKDFHFLDEIDIRDNKKIKDVEAE